MAARCILSLSPPGWFKGGPDFVEPSATMDRAWPADRRLATRNAVADAGWWPSFGDALIDWASRENLSLQRAGVRVLRPRASINLAVLFVPSFFTVLQGIEQRLRRRRTRAASGAARP
ncbi:hypothetical protein [Roseococcus sp. SYP-B2431]|uniref:hypothetical protein n=1 Tax=Roseococcus sp. SYP-B2431 TaxID=2496640 RepID=UPI0013F45E9D|nr:hypothetical protein [Roseococcus sp. SYP-B2431]